MSAQTMAFAEMLFVFGGILAFGFRQLRGLRKLREAREAQAETRED